MSLRVITTHDGSHSLFNEELNETYHSVHGAVQESKHVFIKSGLEFFIQQSNATTAHVLEIGFGTGLNTWLTLQKSLEDQCVIHYTSLEAFPVEETIWKELNYAQSDIGKHWFEKIHYAVWNENEELDVHFHLHKIQDTLQHITLEKNKYDVIYFDAFAPNKQPEMWERSILQKIYDAMSAQSVFVTYCAKGQLKRDLKALGLKVEAIQGPPGKREMIRALKYDS
jgi:tRNA U34 5-methylaminomethyl-2-thiouridine-forming methyltransferase MnmC